MAQTDYLCQACSRRVVVMQNGDVVRSCIFSDECREPIAADMGATCYSLAYLGSLSPEELAELGQ